MFFLAVACAPDGGGTLRFGPAGFADVEADTDSVADTDESDPVEEESDEPLDLTYTGDWDDVYGIDVSGWNPDIDWDEVVAGGIGFAYIKATEGVTFQSSQYANQYDGSHAVGLIRGAYHFALPDVSDGATQADFFVDGGGQWTDDGLTLPGALDIEYNPYGETCFYLTQGEMAAWVQDFVDQYEARTGRLPTIYSTANWWDTCVGSSAFGADPLWVAHYGAVSPNIPVGWSQYTFWQYSSTESVQGVSGNVDGNHFYGDYDALLDLAAGP